MHTHIDTSASNQSGFGASLIMATLGRQEEVDRMIASLLMQTDRRFELIIVDQNPDERLAAGVERGIAAGLSIRHLRLSQCGLSRARNHGLAYARFPVVAFPDDDCWYEADTVALVLEGFSQPNVDGLLAYWVERGEAMNAQGHLQLQDWRNFRDINGSSITLFLRLDALQAMNGFDENLGIGAWFGAGEETDLVMRLLEAGKHIAHYPAARVHHLHGVKPNQDLKRQCIQARRRGRGTGALYAKHGIAAAVILRGCLGPLIRPLLHGLDWRAAINGGATVLGRLEGFIAWHRRRLG